MLVAYLLSDLLPQCGLHICIAARYYLKPFVVGAEEQNGFDVSQLSPLTAKHLKASGNQHSPIIKDFHWDGLSTRQWTWQLVLRFQLGRGQHWKLDTPTCWSCCGSEWVRDDWASSLVSPVVSFAFSLLLTCELQTHDHFGSYWQGVCSPRKTIATAQSLYNRFDLLFPRKDFNRYVYLSPTDTGSMKGVSLACLYVSARMHDLLKKSHDILLVSCAACYPQPAVRSSQ